MKKPLTRSGRYVEYRSGQDGFAWDGVATKVDPGGSPPSRPRILINTRIQGGSVVSRPDFKGPGGVIPAISIYDLNTVDTTTLKNRLRFNVTGGNSWVAQWAGEHNSVGGTRLWWGSTPGLTFDSDTSTWVPTATGALFGFIDTDSDPCNNFVGRYDSDDSWPPVIEKFNTEVYSGDFGALRKIMLIQPPPGLAPSDVLSTPADTIVLSFPGFRCTAMVEAFGKLWLLLTDPSATVDAQVWSYDGFVGTLEYTVVGKSGELGGAMAVYKNELVVTLTGAGSIYVRSAAAVWAAHAGPGGFDSSPYLNSLAQYRDKLMIMSGLDSIYSWDGTTVALERAISATNPYNSAVAVPVYAYCCCTFNDVFYYAWTDQSNVLPVGQFQVIGRYDADNTNKWKDFYTRQGHIYRYAEGAIEPPTTDGAITAMNVYRGRIWVAVTGVPTGNSTIMTHSIQNATYDGWFAVDGTSSGDPDTTAASATGAPANTWDGYGGFHGEGNDAASSFRQIYYFKSI